MISLYKKRYKELADQLVPFGLFGLLLGGAAQGQEESLPAGDFLLNWSMKAKNLIAQSCGEESFYLRNFEKAEQALSTVQIGSGFRRLVAVFLAAKEDYEGGYTKPIRELIEAELFGDELDQAKELLDAGYTTAAAVVAGVVLETNLRAKCVNERITTGKLDKMNADLVKKGVFNSLTGKKITSLAAIRNAAAHGRSDAFTKEDVSSMIADIRQFIGCNELLAPAA